MNEKTNLTHDVLCYVDGLKSERAKTETANIVTRLTKWCCRYLGEMAVSLRRLLKSDKLSGFGKMMLAGAFLYCMMSADIIPDSIPVVGYLDDIVVVLAILMYLNRKIIE